MVDHLYLDEIRWDLKQNAFFQEEVKLGDCLWFMPSISLDHFQEEKPGNYGFKRLIQNLYQCRFQVTGKFFNNNHPDCFHYLLEVLPGLQLFHWNWTIPEQAYLQLGKWYKAFGRLSGQGDPSRENPFVEAHIAKGLIRRGRLERILVVNNIRDDMDKAYPDYQGNLYREAGLEKLGYPHDLEGFLTRLEAYSPCFKELQSTAERDPLDILVFAISLTPIEA